MELQGATVIITGAGSGIGRALALGFAQAGAYVVCAGRRKPRLDQTVAQIETCGGAAWAIACDVTDQAQVQALIDGTMARHGRIDVLYNNAGSFNALGPIWEVDPDLWWQDVTINLRGTMLACRAVVPIMIRQGSGIIINMRGGDQIAGGTGYSCSKVAIVRFTELLARELTAVGAPVLALSMGPGLVRTEMTQLQVDDPQGQRWLPGVGRAMAEGRTRPAEDCARKSVELVSRATAAFHGKSFGPDSDWDTILAEAAAQAR
jgi:NAD(P)-dependent dehydrogenase (short-subunit alcohol dehydrogenase family)